MVSEHSLLSQKRKSRQYSVPPQAVSSLRHKRNSVAKSSSSPQVNLLRKSWIPYLIVSVILLLLLTWLAVGPILKVKTINCIVDHQIPCIDPVQAELHQQLGHHMFSVSFENTFTKIRTAYPLYQEFTVSKELPTTINISVITSPATYMLTDGQQSYLVNGTGVIISSQKVEDLLSITLQTDQFSTLHIQEPLEPEFHNHLMLLISILNTSVLEYQKVEWRSEAEIIVYVDDKKVVTTLSNLSQQLELAKKILEYPLPEQEWSTLDLRFDKPILRKE